MKRSPGRREFVLAAASAAAVLLGPRLARAARGRRILMVGSSTMAGPFGRFVELGLEEMGFRVHRRARVGSSLSRPDWFDWFAEGRELYQSFRPDGAIVMFAGNDTQAIAPFGRGRWVPFHREQAWTESYRDRVQRFADTLAPRGEGIVWVGAPIMRSDELSERIRRANRIWADEMRWRRAAAYVDTWLDLADRSGQYTSVKSVDGEVRKIRARDGMHVSKAGAKLLARKVLPIATRTLGKRSVPRSSRADLRCTAGRHWS